MAKRFTLVALFLLASITVSLSPKSASAQTGGSLAGTSWVLTETAIQRAAFTPALGSPAPTLMFSNDGNISGNAICNGYSGPYTQSGNSITVGSLISTARACVDDALNKQEALIKSVLQGQVAVTVSGNKLTLSSAAGALNFVQAGSTGGTGGGTGSTGGNTGSTPSVPATGTGPVESGSVLPFLLLGLAVVTTVAGGLYVYTRGKASQSK